MLVLSRRRNEKIIIFVPMPDGTHRRIEIMQIDIQGNHSRLGIEADSDIVVHREEVVNQIVAQGGTVI